jgi:hypothetical protein
MTIRFKNGKRLEYSRKSCLILRLEHLLTCSLSFPEELLTFIEESLREVEENNENSDLG